MQRETLVHRRVVVNDASAPDPARPLRRRGSLPGRGTAPLRPLLPAIGNGDPPPGRLARTRPGAVARMRRRTWTQPRSVTAPSRPPLRGEC
jgi:hypothetical protein